MSAGVSETDGRSDRSGKREVAHGHASWRWTSLNVSEVVNGLTDCVMAAATKGRNESISEIPDDSSQEVACRSCAAGDRLGDRNVNGLGPRW